MKYIVTDEEKDPTAFQTLIVDNVTPDMLKVLDESDRYNSDIENINKVQDKLLTVMEEHDIRKGDLEAIFQKLIKMYWEPFDKILKQVGYSYNDTLDECISIALGTRGTSEFVDECLRNVRISDIKKLRTSYFNKLS